MSEDHSHIVEAGETLGQIAKTYGKSMAELIRINHLASPNRIQTGQTIYLDQQYANSVQVMLLDGLRYPIAGLECQLKYDGKVIACASGQDGLLPLFSTKDIDSSIEISIKDRLGQWQKVAESMSKLGRHWITLVSNAIHVDLPMEKHDQKEAGKPFTPAYTQDKRHDGKAGGDPIKHGHPVKKHKGKAHNTTVLECDFPPDLLAYFANYREYTLTQDDWKNAARRLICEAAAIKAIHDTEAPHGSFYSKRLKNGYRVPTILYERQYFHRLTCANGPELFKKDPKTHKKRRNHGVGVKGCSSPHDTDPDICWPAGFMHYGKLDQSYLRLAKAYRLNPDAALESVSWGGFQIMGANFGQADYTSIGKMVTAMCTSEKEHLDALVRFIDSDPTLKKALQDKDWVTFAKHYNGPAYARNSYPEKMQAAYEKLSKEA